MIDLLNFFFLFHLFLSFPVKNWESFKFLRHLDKFSKEVVVNYNSPEAAPLSNKSEIIDFKRLRGYVRRKITGHMPSFWKHLPVVSYWETTLKDLSLTNYSCYYHLLFKNEIKWIFSFQLLPPSLKRRINMHFPTIWNWKFVTWKKLLKFLLTRMKYSWIFFPKKKCFHKPPFSKRIHWPLIQYKTCLKTYKKML